jgi:hypothetical protein
MDKEKQGLQVRHLVYLGLGVSVATFVMLAYLLAQVVEFVRVVRAQ